MKHRHPAFCRADALRSFYSPAGRPRSNLPRGVRQRAGTLITQEKSILEMGRGAIMERADYEMRAMIRNILDPNTSAKAARKLNITLTFKPGDDRQTIVVECVAKSTLASTNAITTMLYVLDEDTVVEMAPQIPGQLAVDAGEQEAPPKLRLIHSA